MIPNSYLTQAQVQALVDSLKMGSGNTTQCDNSISASPVPTLNGYITGTLLANILYSDLLTSPTNEISEVGLTATELSYLDGMRARIADAWTDAYADVPLLNPSNAVNLRSGQSVNNAIDLFIQTIFQYDTRFGARNRLPEANYHGGEHYQLPARAGFVAHPYIRTVMGLHGAPDVVRIDDTGTDGVYQVTTTNAHGLYNGISVYSTGAGGTAATDDILVSSFATTGNTFTTTGNHNLMDHQRFHCEQADAGDALFDLQNRFFGWQRRPYVKADSATTFTLYRDYNLTNQLKPTEYTGTLTTTNVSGNMHIDCGEIQMFIDGLGYTIATDIGDIKTMAVTSYNQSTGEFTHTQLWTAPDDGVSIRFSGSTGLDTFKHELFYSKTANNKCKLYWDINLTRQFFLNRYSATDYSGKVESTTNTGSAVRVNFTEPHNMVNGAIARLFNVTGVAYDAQTALTAVVPEYINALTFDPKFVAFNGSGTGIAVPDSGFNYAYTTNSGVTWTYATLPTRLGPSTGTNYWQGLQYSAGDNQWLLTGHDVTQDEVYYTSDAINWTVLDLNPTNSTDPSVAQGLWDLYSDNNQFVAGGEDYIYASSSASANWTKLYITTSSGQYQTTLFHPRPQGHITSGPLNGCFYALNGLNSSNTGRSYVYSTNSTWYLSGDLKSRAWDAGVTECVAMSNLGVRAIAISKTGGKVFYTDNIANSGWSSVTLSGVTWVSGRNVLARDSSKFIGLCNSGNEIAISSDGVTWTRTSTPFTVTDLIYDTGRSRFYVLGATGSIASTTDGYNWVTGAGEVPHFTVSDNTVYEDGQIIRLFNNTTSFGSYTATKSGVDYTWTAPTPTSKTNYYRIKKVAGYTDRVQLYTDSTYTQLYAPWSTNFGTYTLTNLLFQPVFYTKVIDSDTVELYIDSALTNLWYPTTAPSNTGLTADFRITDLEAFESAVTLATYIKPNVYFKTDTYTSVYVYWDRNLTDPVPGATVTGSNTISAVYSLEAQSGSSTWNFATNIELKPVFYVNALTDYPKVFELFVDYNRTIPYNSPAISTPQTSGSFIVDIYSTQNAYKITDVICVNPGNSTYWYKDWSGATEDRVNARVTNQWFTANYETNYCEHFPTTLAYEFDPVNQPTPGVGYFGYVRYTKSGSDETTAGGRKGLDTTLYTGIGSPMVVSKQYPGQFYSDNALLLWFRPDDDVGTDPATDRLNQNAPEWDAANSVDQALRRWPTHIQPTSVAWSIEQPNQTLESMNYTRYTRSKEITQYRLKLTYRQMTREEFNPFLNIIQAARGSFKPFRYTLPTQDDGSQAAFVYDREGSDAIEVILARSNNTSGSRVIEVDGLPCDKSISTPVFNSGHSTSLNTPNTTGQLAMIIHDVVTNVYGEANIRINNAIPGDIDFGHELLAHPTEVDVFIDGNSIDVSVDTRGYHQFEVELVTKRIF